MPHLSQGVVEEVSSPAPDTLLSARERRLYEQVPSFIIVMRGPDHIVEYVNDAHRRIFGSENWVGKSIRAAFPSISGQGYFEHLDEVYRSGNVYSVDDAEARFLADPDKPEQIRWLNFVYAPLTDDAGTITGIFCEGFDVTERHRANAIEIELAHSREQSERQQRLYEAVIGNTPDLAYVFDLQHRFIYINPGLLRMWGKTWDEAINKTCLELGYEPWHAAMHDREIDHVAATKQPIRGEVPFEGTFGRRIYDYIFVPVFDEHGEVEAVAGTTRDVTERKEMEERTRHLLDELSEADRRKTEFLAVLAHELRNPLAPIRNAAQIIRMAGGTSEVVQKSVTMLERQLAQMVRLVDDLMDVSRISRGNIGLKRARVELAAVVQQAVETSRPMIEQAGQSLTVELPGECVMLDADAVRVSQAISNVLNNASKFSAAGSRIALRASFGDGGVAISIRDQGIGIAPEVLRQVFDMFVQAEQGPARARGGLGIGLALVRTLMELHGGSVEARSDGPGHGSEFVLRLPASTLPATSSRAAPEALPINGRRILVVDDNRDAAQSMAQILDQMGNTTHIVYDGTAAVEAALRFVPEMVLLDLGLPGLDGYEVCRRILDGGSARPLMIAVTGWGDSADRQRSSAAGFSAHLVKPLDYAELAGVIHKLAG